MHSNINIPYYYQNMYDNNFRQGPKRPPYIPNNRPIGSNFLLPFALGFVSSPLIFGATRPRPPYYNPNIYYNPVPPYYPYY